MAKIFISHSSKDKEFVRKIASDISELGHVPWFDEWEIKVGDCIVTKVEKGITESDYVVIVLSPNSVASGWVEREWKAKYWNEIEKNSICVLPVLYQDCDIPTLLKTKKYADFRRNYTIGFHELMGAINPVVSNKVALLEFKSPEYANEISKLLAKVHGRSIPVSQCIAEALNIAQKANNQALQEFCKNELTGNFYSPTKENDKDVPSYRLIQVYLSPGGKVNPNYFGWNGNSSAIFEHMEEDNEHFFPVKLLIRESVSQIESKDSENASKQILSVSLRQKDVLPNPEHPNEIVYAYAKGDSYLVVLERIRTELSKHLLDILPKVEQ